MFIFDMTNILTLVLVVIATVLFIFLAQEVKKSAVAAIPLFAFLISLIVHTVQIITLSDEYNYLFGTLCQNMVLDYVFLLVSFISYLWADDVEAKKRNKKSYDNSLEWLWKKI